MILDISTKAPFYVKSLEMPPPPLVTNLETFLGYRCPTLCRCPISRASSTLNAAAMSIEEPSSLGPAEAGCGNVLAPDSKLSKSSFRFFDTRFSASGALVGAQREGCAVGSEGGSSTENVMVDWEEMGVL